MISVLLRHKREDGERKGGQAKTDTVTRMMYPQAKESLEISKKNRKYFMLEPPEGAQPCQHSDFTVLDTRTEINVFSNLDCGNSLWTALGNEYIHHSLGLFVETSLYHIYA